MNCKNCGTMLSSTNKFCLNCGTPVESVNLVQPVITPQPIESEVQLTPPVEAPVAPIQPTAPGIEAQATPVIEQGIAENSTVGLPIGQLSPMPTVIPPQSSTPITPFVTPQPIVGVPNQLSTSQTFIQQPTKRDNKLVYFIIGLVVVTAVILGILFFVFGKKEDNKEDTTPKNEPTVNNPVVEEKSTYELELDGFVYNIPTEYTAQAQDDYIALYNDTYYIELSAVKEASFITATDDDAKTIVENMGATVISSETKTIDGKKYAVVRAVYSGIDCAFVFSKSTLDHTAIGFGYRLDYTYNSEIEEDIATLVAQVEYNSSANLESKIDINVSELFR